MTNTLFDILEKSTKLSKKHIQNIIKFLDDGCTIPFIARYRKEFTGNASDEELREFFEHYEYFQKVIKRKEEILKLLKEKDFLNEKIEKSLQEAQTLQACEDIYAPYKDKKSTRTTKAIDNGLEPLANIIQCMKYDKDDIFYKAKRFLNSEIKNIEDAINGAKDIIAQRYADDFKSKEIIRNIINSWGTLQIKEAKEFKSDGLYTKFANTNEKIKYIKAHKLLAILRAVSEKELSLKVDIDENHILENIKKYKIPKDAKNSKDLVFEAYKDGLKRLLLPSLKNEATSTLKEKAQKDAIELFGRNLKELLLTAPLINNIILGIDPGYKTGCKIAVIDENGNYLDSNVIYPTKPKQDITNSSKIVLELIKKYNITAIAIGNGTASNETAKFIENLLEEYNLDIKYAIVSEIGASVYSASKIAAIEYPNLDVTIRGAISIAQRLRDPMAALVKIDPKSLGIGQYQHDVNQKELSNKLENITIDLVNKVGVDLNSASYKLLSFISGISENLAKNIIEYKEKNGFFKTKSELLKVKGLGQKAYEQSVGFLRIKDGLNEFDNTSIHPEDYLIAKRINKNIDNDASFFNISNIKYEDIKKELLNPGYDVRDDFSQIRFENSAKDINELKIGDIVNVIVRNITDFGAFVDIGLKDDALLHISQISNKRVSHPSDVLNINQTLDSIKILDIDLNKKRVSLSLKD